MDNPSDLINVALETLIKERYELPALSTLDRLVRRVRTVINQRYFGMVLKRLNAAETERLESLLKTEGRASRSLYQRLKQMPGNPTLKHLQEWLTQLEWLESRGSRLKSSSGCCVDSCVGINARGAVAQHRRPTYTCA